MHAYASYGSQGNWNKEIPQLSVIKNKITSPSTTKTLLPTTHTPTPYRDGRGTQPMHCTNVHTQSSPNTYSSGVHREMVKENGDANRQVSLH
jgi:hypothetical protein